MATDDWDDMARQFTKHQKPTPDELRKEIDRAEEVFKNAKDTLTSFLFPQTAGGEIDYSAVDLNAVRRTLKAFMDIMSDEEPERPAKTTSKNTSTRRRPSDGQRERIGGFLSMLGNAVMPQAKEKPGKHDSKHDNDN